MIITIGVDTVEVKRFNIFSTYCHKKLLRIFSQEEIDYCLSTTQKSAERFAVRFAAKEAFLKALSQVNSDMRLSLLTVSRLVSVAKKNNSAPQLEVAWTELKQKYPLTATLALNTALTISHTDSNAIAVVVLYIK